MHVFVSVRELCMFVCACVRAPAMVFFCASVRVCVCTRPCVYLCVLKCVGIPVLCVERESVCLCGWVRCC